MGTAVSVRDVLRLSVVSVCAVIAVVWAVIGSGAAGGTAIAEAAGGALSTEATMVAPAGPAFSIWTLIYVGLVAYAVWQFFPSQRSAPRQRKLGYLVAASLVANAAWIAAVQLGSVPLSSAVIVVLLVVLLATFRLTWTYPATGRTDAIITDTTLGVYLGWVCVATAANIAATLADAGFTGWSVAPQLWGVAVVAVAAAAGIALALWSPGRIAPAVTVCWGLSWVAVARLTGELHSVSVAVAAIVCVILILIVAIVRKVLVRDSLAKLASA